MAEGYALALFAAAVLAIALGCLPALKPVRRGLLSGGALILLSDIVVALGEDLPWVGRVLPKSLAPALATAALVAWWIAGAAIGAALLKFVLDRWIFPETDQPRGRKLFADLSAGLIYLIAGVGILSALLGPPLAGLLATSGIVAIVVGLALQNTLSDLFSGLALNIELPFRAGDWVGIAGVGEGQILEINWRATRFRTRAGDVLVVANSVLAKAVATNHYRPSRSHVVSARVTFGFDVDPALASAVLLAAAEDLPMALRLPPPAVLLLTFTELGVAYELDFYIADYAEAPQALSDALRRIWSRAAEKGIAIATPRRAVALEPCPPPAAPGRHQA
jgi:small-conductance mechanosensitive channel